MPPLIITNENAWKVYGDKAEHWQGRQLAAIKPLKPRMFAPGKLHNCPLNTTEIPVFPRNQWRGLFNAQLGQTLLDRTRPMLSIHDQGKTNFCWAHGTVRAFEVLKAIRHNVSQRLSSASIAVPITGGRNIGGWPEKALMQMQSQGACSLGLWPDSQYRSMPDPALFNAEALRNRMMRWVELQTFDEIWCAALRFIPTILPLMWWRHVVCVTGAYLDENDNPGLWFDNSWGPDWSDEGRGILMEEKAQPTEGAFAPLDIGFAV